MKTLRRYQLLVIIALVLAAKLVSSLLFSSPSTNTLGLTALQATSTPAPTATPRPAPTATVVAGDPIPIKPLTDLTSLEATVKINVNGLLNGERAQGDLTALLNTNDQNKSQIKVTGGLLGDVVAQVGGAVVGLFAPREVNIYKVPEGTYVVVNGLFPVCVKPNAPKATEALDKLSPQSLMETLTGSEVARGKFVGNETVNGIPAKHYVINGDAFLAAAQKSSDPNLRTFGEALWSAEDADLFISADGGYPISFRGSYSGEFEPLKFQGDFDVQIDLTSVNTNPTVELPNACNNPISQ